MKLISQKIKLIIAVLLPFIGVNQLTHWLFPVLSIILLLFSSKSRLHYPKTFINISIVYLFWILITGVISGNIFNPLRKFSETVLVITWSILIINLFMQQKEIMVKTIFYSGIIVSVYILLTLDGLILNFKNLPFGKNGIALFLFTSLVFGFGTKNTKIKYFGILIIVIIIFLSGSLKNIFAALIVLGYQFRSFFKLKFSYLIFPLLMGVIISYLNEIELFLNSNLTYVFALSKTQVLLGLVPEIAIASNQITVRENLIKGGIELFYNNPIFGIGLENSRLFLSTYTHNHFVELLASMGVFGFIIFNLFSIPFFKFFKLSLNFTTIVFLAYMLTAMGNRLYDNYSFFLILSFGWSSLIINSPNHIFHKNKTDFVSL